MTEERPEGRDESDRSVTPDRGDDGLEAPRGSDTDAPFRGLRSAADIFGAPLTEDEWPSRRERREAERAARQAGQPEPEPFTAPASLPAPASAAAPGSAPDADADAGQPGEPDPGATQAISMPEELALPGGVAGRVPPPAAVPPVSNAPDPRAISLPTARSDRDARAAESRAIEDERRRTDPDGLGRSDVDWLGRARPAATSPDDRAVVPPAFAGGPEAQPVGVEDVLPSTTEPPTFTELLRLHDDDGAPQADRPFDWSVLDDETGEVPTALTRDDYDTNLVAAGSWATGDDRRAADVVPPVAVPPAVVPPVAVPGDDAADERTTPSGSSWSLSDEAARTGEVFPGDVTDDRTAVLGTTPGPDDTSGPSARRAAEDPEDHDDDLDGHAPTAVFAPRSAAATPPPSVLPAAPAATPDRWWEDESAGVPPLVEPEQRPARPGSDTPRSASTTPWQDGTDRGDRAPARGDRAPARGSSDDVDEPAARGPLAPEDIDQSEWQGRETSDTGVIKDLFGTEAIDQIRGLPEDTSTRMMPAVPGGARDAAPGVGGTGAPADRDNFINEGFARLQSEGRRGKQLLVYGSIAIIVVLLVLVFVLTRWILGNTIDEHPAAPSSSPAAAAAVVPVHEAVPGHEAVPAD